jgi:hypothetical protein
MSSLDFDLDSRMSKLESEWRQAYESSLAARAELRALSKVAEAKSFALERACERLDQAEALKSRIMAGIERLEERMLGND